MNVLITGGAGYIGSNIVLALKDRGINSIVLDNLSTGHKKLIPENITFIKGDIKDSYLLKTIITKYKIDSVIHLAASIIVSDSIQNPLYYYENNTVNSHILIKACIDNGVKRFIFSSTAAVYGNNNYEIVSEHHPTKPVNPYGHSKLMVEQMLEDVGKASEFKYISLRYFNVAGADFLQRSGQLTKNSTNLIKILAEHTVGKREKIEIFGSDYPTQDGTCIRDYIHVSDLANAHINALQYLYNEGDNQILNVGYGHGYSVKEIIKTTEKLIGKNLNVELVGRRQGDLPCVIAGVKKINHILDWRPKYDDINFILKSAIDWEQHS